MIAYTQIYCALRWRIEFAAGRVEVATSLDPIRVHEVLILFSDGGCSEEGQLDFASRARNDTMSADTRKLRAIKSRANFRGSIRAQSVDPLSPKKKIVNDLRVSPQQVTELVSVTG